MSPKLCFTMHYAKFIFLFLFYCEISSQKRDYCDLCPCPNHILCKYNSSGPDKFCKGALLSKDDIYTIVEKINERRNFVAMGRARNPGLPQAANMRKISWSDELASFAQRWLDQCDNINTGKTDECQNLVNMEIGQNVASVSGSSPGLNIKSFVDIWFMKSLEYTGKVSYYNSSLDKNTDQFTQLIWAETRTVGCGKARFYIDKVPLERLVCNFAPRGNIHGRPVYVIGLPATQCPDETQQDEVFSGLCSARVNVKSNKTTAEKLSVSSFLRVLNLFNETVTHVIDPIQVDEKQLIREINERNQKTRHIFNRTRDPQSFGLMAVNNPWNFMNLSHKLNQERGHSRMYHSQDYYKTSHPPNYDINKETNNFGHDFRRQMQNGPIPLQVIQQCTRKLPTQAPASPLPVTMCMLEPNCFVRQCTRGPKNCCVQPTCGKSLCCKPSCDHNLGQCSCSGHYNTYATNPTTQQNCQCIEVKNCCGTLPPPMPIRSPPPPFLQPTSTLPPLPTPPAPPNLAPMIAIPMSPGAFRCPFRRNNKNNQHVGTSKRPDFHYYDLFPNLALRDGEDEDLDLVINSRKVKTIVPSVDYSRFFDRTTQSQASISILQSVKSEINNFNPSRQQFVNSEILYPNHEYYDSIIAVRNKRESDDETSFKPFWQMEEEHFSKPLQLKSLRYTTLPRKYRKSKSTAKRITEPITILSDEENDHQHSIKEKILSFEELMSLRKNTAENFDYRRKYKPVLRGETTKPQPNTTRAKTTATTTAKTTAKQQNEKTTTTKTVVTHPMIPKIKSCSRKLTCTWTTPTLPGENLKNRIGHGAGMGSRTPFGFQDGCTRTSTCTRAQPERNIQVSEHNIEGGINEEGEEEGVGDGKEDGTGKGGGGDEEYCEKRSLNVQRRDSGISEENYVKTQETINTLDFVASTLPYSLPILILENNKKPLEETDIDCKCNDKNTKEKRHIPKKKTLAKTATDTKVRISYQNLYKSVLSKVIKSGKRNLKNHSNGCLCNESFSISSCPKPIMLCIIMLQCIFNVKLFI